MLHALFGGHGGHAEARPWSISFFIVRMTTRDIAWAQKWLIRFRERGKMLNFGTKSGENVTGKHDFGKMKTNPKRPVHSITDTA